MARVGGRRTATAAAALAAAVACALGVQTTSVAAQNATTAYLNETDANATDHVGGEDFLDDRNASSTWSDRNASSTWSGWNASTWENTTALGADYTNASYHDDFEDFDNFTAGACASTHAREPARARRCMDAHPSPVRARCESQQGCLTMPAWPQWRSV